MRAANGFTLIEMVATLIVVGIVAAFGGMLLSEGVRGYTMASANAGTALKAQIALDRIALELKEADSVTAVTATSVSYTNLDISASQRTLALSGQDLVITEGAGSNILIDGVTGLAIASVAANLDNNAANGNEVESISVQFSRGGAQFATLAYPREMLAHP